MKKSIYIQPETEVYVALPEDNYGLGTGSPDVDNPDDVLSRRTQPWEDEESSETGGTTSRSLWDEQW